MPPTSNWSRPRSPKSAHRSWRIPIADRAPRPAADEVSSKRNVGFLALTSLFNDISSEMILNLLPFYLFNVLGAPTSIIGLIEGLSEATSSLIKARSGRLADIRGRRRKDFAVAGYGFSTLAKAFFLIASTWPGVLAARFGDRVGKGIRAAPRDALLADSVSEARRGLAFGLHRAADTLGAFLGLGAALWVVLRFRPDAGGGLSAEAFQAAVAIGLIPATLAVLTLAFGVREPRRTKKASTASEGPESVAEVEADAAESDTSASVESAAPRTGAFPLDLGPGIDRRFLSFVGIVCLFTLGNSTDAFLLLRAQDLGASVPMTLVLLMGFNLVYLLVAGPAGSLSDKLAFGRKRLVQVGWALYALIYLGLALAGSVWRIALLFLVYGLYYGLTEGVLRAMVADLVPSERRATAYGIFHAATGLTLLPASVLAGLLWQGAGSWEGFGPRAPFLFGAALSLLALALFALWARQGDRAKEGLA